MTVLENIQVALQRKLGVSFKFWKSDRIIDQVNVRAMELLDAVNLADFAKQASSTFPMAVSGRSKLQQLSRSIPELILLDEPTQGIGHEADRPDHSADPKMAQGRTVLIVEHNLNVVAELSDMITVLARGSGARGRSLLRNFGKCRGSRSLYR